MLGTSLHVFVIELRLELWLEMELGLKLGLGLGLKILELVLELGFGACIMFRVWLEKELQLATSYF